MLVFQRILQLLILVIFTYGLYIYPLTKGVFWGLEYKLRLPWLIVSTLLVTFLLFYYFTTKTKNRFLKLLVRWGIGAGYFSLLITWGLLCLDTVIFINNEIKCLFLIIGTVSLVIYALRQGKIIVVKPIEIHNSKLSKQTRLVFISDVHIGSQEPRYLNKIIEQIQQLHPDYVFIGGDLIDSSAITINDLHAFKQLTMPIYFVTGNHEYILENYNQLLSELASVNITWLDNEAVVLDDIQIVGVNDYLNRSEKSRLIHDLSDLKHYVIALVHKPLSLKSLIRTPDLMLSGHTHNGQLFPFGLLVKLSFPQSYGLYKQGESLLYVSSGVGMWGSSMRFGTQNELVYLTLKPK